MAGAVQGGRVAAVVIVILSGRGRHLASGSIVSTTPFECAIVCSISLAEYVIVANAPDWASLPTLVSRPSAYACVKAAVVGDTHGGNVASAVLSSLCCGQVGRIVRLGRPSSL